MKIAPTQSVHSNHVVVLNPGNLEISFPEGWVVSSRKRQDADGSRSSWRTLACHGGGAKGP